MRKNIVSSGRFKMSKFLAVVAVFTIIALLFMIEKVAETVVSAGNSMGINMPVVPVFRQAAANMVLIGSGIMLTVFSGLILIPVVKFSMAIVGIGLAFYGIYNLYKFIQGKPITDILPRK